MHAPPAPLHPPTEQESDWPPESPALAEGLVAAWVCVPVVAVFLSLLHELEHDLVHNLYFSRSRFVQNAMLAGVWMMRPNTVNPWFRRRLHVHHHKASGTESDWEERAITNGERWGLRRLLMTGDGFLAVALRPRQTVEVVRAFLRAQRDDSPERQRRLVRRAKLAYFPLGFAYHGGWYLFIGLTVGRILAGAAGVSVALSPGQAAALHALDVVAVALLAPNALRTFALHFVSSNVHYFGDVEPGNVVQQTQVWTAWWTAPFQLFCFNFGGTHAIHHFVVGDPFYVRQAIAKDAHVVLRRNGVRFNDFGSLGRANRWNARGHRIVGLLRPEPSR